MTLLNPATFGFPIWARKGAAPAGVFFSHARATGLGTFVVGTANSTGGAVNPIAESISQGPVRRDSVRAGPSGPFARTGEVLGCIARFGSGAITAGNIAANISVGRAIAGVSFAFGGFSVLIVSPRTALTAGLALSQGVMSVANPAIGSASIHNLSGAPVDPGAQVFDWVLLVNRPSSGLENPLPPILPRSAPSGQQFMRRFRATIDHGAIAAAATLEATTVITPRVPLLAPNTALNRLPVVYPVPTAALPAGFALSHARVTADNTIAVGLSNISGAGPTDPPAVTYDLYVFTPPSRQL